MDIWVVQKAFLSLLTSSIVSPKTLELKSIKMCLTRAHTHTHTHYTLNLSSFNEVSVINPQLSSFKSKRVFYDQKSISTIPAKNHILSHTSYFHIIILMMEKGCCRIISLMKLKKIILFSTTMSQASFTHWTEKTTTLSPCKTDVLQGERHLTTKQILLNVDNYQEKKV
jgi:hypothetical protein